MRFLEKKKTPQRKVKVSTKKGVEKEKNNQKGGYKEGHAATVVRVFYFHIPTGCLF